MDTDGLRCRFQRLEPFLDERGRRLFAANEALALGRGGVTAVSAATGIARSTINRGIAELKGLAATVGGSASGRRAEARGRHQPGLLSALEALIEGAIRGDPESPLRWVSRSQRNIAEALRRQGFEVSQKLVGVLLRQLDYSCQANRKTREGTSHPDRDAQFEHINAAVKAAIAAGEPAISVDTKKKELVGDFKNGGRELRPKGDPEPVRVHDFEIPELGKVAPYGVYDIAANQGWVNVGIDADTAAFAVESIRRWWQRLGRARYPEARRLAHHRRLRRQQWRSGPPVEARAAEASPTRPASPSPSSICRPAPANGTRSSIACSPIITQNWRGKPLVSHQVIIQLIAATTTDAGLTVTCDIDANALPKGNQCHRRRNGRDQPATRPIPRRLELHHQTTTARLVKRSYQTLTGFRGTEFVSRRGTGLLTVTIGGWADLANGAISRPACQSEDARGHTRPLNHSTLDVEARVEMSGQACLARLAKVSVRSRALAERLKNHVHDIRYKEHSSLWRQRRGDVDRCPA